ncbi:MAG: hypothetical protein HKN40_08380 [Winogradskyella sp.]|uniref:DUF6418 domain-containing protein n=1 Tax=Winogradskyella sp. TaxID=1883156 RepID=UPI00182E4B6A|nr:hypothetical protein [Winogradskyella sp.]
MIFICFLPFMIQYLWMFASILVIEQGAYINEQERYGKFVFSNFYLLIFFITSVISFILFFKIFKSSLRLDLPTIKIFKSKEISITYAISITVIIIAYISLFSSPSVYWSDEVTKFNYWDTAAYPGLKALLGSTIGYLPFIFGLIFKRYKKTTITLILLYLIYLVGVDQKFTAFLYGFIGFITSYSFINFKRQKENNILNFKKRYLAVLGALIFTLVLIRYTKKNPFEYLNLTPVESVFYRAFGLQAHVFWGVNEKYNYNDHPHSWDISELNYGMHVMMKDFTPEFHQRYLERLWASGVSWTNAYPAVLMRIFPLPIALAFHFIIFAIVPLVYVLMIKTIQRDNYIIAIILFQLTLWLTNIYSMAYFYRLTKVVIIFLLLAFVAHIYNRAKKLT